MATGIEAGYTPTEEEMIVDLRGHYSNRLDLLKRLLVAVGA
jgi:hypothetical protein